MKLRLRIRKLDLRIRKSHLRRINRRRRTPELRNPGLRLPTAAPAQRRKPPRLRIPPIPTAYKWFARALHQDPANDRVQRDLEVLWKQMTPDERQIAQRQ